MTICTPEWIAERIAQADRLGLFLDYDGTLADFETSPDQVNPDPELATLVEHLARHPRIQVAMVSGRRLSHVQELVPVSGVLRAGTYGVELEMPSGERADRLSYEAVRPILDQVKPAWAALIADREGFFLEDKGWALALHARFADDEEADVVLGSAREIAAEAAEGGPFRILGGHKFLEIGPKLANKGKTIAHLLAHYVEPGALTLYLGDDDKDEEAFAVIKDHGGLAIVVAPEPRETLADCRLPSPQHARRWLWALVEEF